MIVDDYAACPTIVDGGRSGIQKDEGAPSVCCAPRKRPNTGRAGGTLAPGSMRPETGPTSHPEIMVPEFDARVGFRDDGRPEGPMLIGYAHLHR